jgi:hypothetical protein
LIAFDASAALAFLTARRNTDRSAAQRWLKAQGLPDTAEAKQAALARWGAVRHYADPALRELAWGALRGSLGHLVGSETPFPCMVWYGGASDTYGGSKFTGTIADYVEHVLVARSREIAPKRTGWVVTPTSCTDGHRTNASTTAVHALNLDCDGRGSWDKLLAALDTLGLCRVAYQSGGWTAQTPKWHVILPLARPFDTSTPEKIEAWKSAYNSARVVLGAVAELPGEGFDPTVETPSIPIFITERRAEEDPDRVVVHRWGAALDLDALVGALPVVEELEEARSTRSAAAPVTLDDGRLEKIVAILEAPMSKILSGRRDLYMAIPGALLDRGVQPDDVRTIVAELSLRCSGDPSYTATEVEARHKQHVHDCDTTIDKFESGEHYTRIGTVNERWPEVAEAIDEALPDKYMLAFLAMQEAGRPQAAVPDVPSAFDAPPEPLRVSFDLHDLRRTLQSLKRKKESASSFKQKVQGCILDALLKGDDLVPRVDGEPLGGGYEDGKPWDRELAIVTVMKMIAFKLPKGTLFDAVVPLIERSLHKMRLPEEESVDALLKKAEKAFGKAVRGKLKLDDERHAEIAAERARRASWYQKETD